MLVQNSFNCSYVTYVGDQKCPMVWVPSGGVVAVVARLVGPQSEDSEVYITVRASSIPNPDAAWISLEDYAFGKSNPSQWLFGKRVHSSLFFCPLQYVIVKAEQEMYAKKQQIEVSISTMSGAVSVVDDFMLEQLGMKP